MPDNSDNNNRQVKSNGVANQSSMADAFRRLNVQDNHDHGGMAPFNPYPDRPGEPDCGYYMRNGTCGYGSNCRFNHPPYSGWSTQIREELPERTGQPDCGYYLKTGTCKYGSTCKFNHPRGTNGAEQVEFNVLGLPMRKGEKSCSYYMRTGACKFGAACKFNHPQPTQYGNAVPVSGATAYGSNGSSVVTSSNLSYAGGFSSWSSPRATYVSTPYLQGQQVYVPLVLPPQGFISSQNWNTYMGNSGIWGSNPVYNVRNPGSNEQPQLVPDPDLPERPDQPECRYFINNGTCKYGFDCKYNHPRERVAFLASTNGPQELPSRPLQGHTLCSTYAMYGICKFGPNCRFDHPFLGYPHAYGISLPQPVNSAPLGYPMLPLPSHTDNEDNKHQNADSSAKISDDQYEQAGSPPPQTSEASSEPLHD